jgi:hypothetical protein
MGGLHRSRPQAAASEHPGTGIPSNANVPSLMGAPSVAPATPRMDEVVNVDPFPETYLLVSKPNGARSERILFPTFAACEEARAEAPFNRVYEVKAYCLEVDMMDEGDGDPPYPDMGHWGRTHHDVM